MFPNIDKNRFLIEKCTNEFPKKLFFKPYFWSIQYQWVLIMLIAGSTAATSYLFFTMYQGVINQIICLLIHGVGFIGFFIGIRAIANLWVEFSIASIMEERGNQKLKEIRGSSITFQLNSFLKDIVPASPCKPAPAMHRLASQIHTEAKDRKFESVQILVQPYKEEAIRLFSPIMNLQRISMWLGILGTFFGLMLVISQFPQMVEQLFHQTQDGKFAIQIEKLNPLLDGLGLAFGTSVAGIVASISLALFQSIIKRYHDIYFKKIEDVTLTLLSLAYNSLNFNEISSDLKRINKSFEQIANHLFSQNELIQEQTITFQNSITEFKKSNESFVEFIKSVKNDQVEFVNSLKTMQQKFLECATESINGLHLESIIQSSADGLQEAGKTIGNTFVTQMETIVTAVSNLRNDMVLQQNKITDEIKRSTEIISNRTLKNVNMMTNIVPFNEKSSIQPFDARLWNEDIQSETESREPNPANSPHQRGGRLLSNQPLTENVKNKFPWYRFLTRSLFLKEKQ